MSSYATEQGHWYDENGNPAYTIVGKNGKERPTTLRDARKLNLVPSYSMIARCAAQPGLDAWKQDQTILAVLTLPRIEGESEQDYIARIKEDAKATAAKAAERGTQIHAWIEQGFRGDMEPQGVPYFKSALATIEKDCGDCEWHTEKSFATKRYGGKVDLHNDEYLIDIKTTEKDLATIKTWDEHAMQLSAYDYGMPHGSKLLTGYRQCGILYVHVRTAESRLIWLSEEELQRGLECFMALIDYWYAKNKMKEVG